MTPGDIHAAPYCLVIVSSRFRMVLATVVQAASSVGFHVAWLRRADRDQLRRLLRFFLVVVDLPLREFEQDAHLGRRGTPCGALAEEKAYARLRIGSGFQKPALGQGARRFHVGGIVEQHQSLQGRVGNQAARSAFLAVGCVEGSERGGRHGTFPERVHAAAVEVRPRALVILLRRECFAARQFLPEPGGW